MRLTQLRTPAGERRVAATEGSKSLLLPGIATTYMLARAAILMGLRLEGLVQTRLESGPEESVNLERAYAEGRILPPIDHPDPAHLLVTGTGLTHLGSAESRDKMHKDMADPAKQTDSMKMFKLGIEGGKAKAGQPGVAPEWFYKGDGSIVVAPGSPFPSPEFALDGGDEGEIVGCYVCAPDGTPWRVGFALGNEFADHVLERQNYLYLAHSKLRPCSFGPELLIGELPAHVEGKASIRRGNQTIWEKQFLSGESNMCHSIANLELHHFKYGLFRRPGDVHVHYYGAATLSCLDGIVAKEGDVFELAVADFGLPLRNGMSTVPAPYIAARVL
jgi:hypothetical protein